MHLRILGVWGFFEKNEISDFLKLIKKNYYMMILGCLESASRPPLARLEPGGSSSALKSNTGQGGASFKINIK